jgi:hypothetical protein
VTTDDCIYIISLSIAVVLMRVFIAHLIDIYVAYWHSYSMNSEFYYAMLSKYQLLLILIWKLLFQRLNASIYQLASFSVNVGM